MGPFPPLYMLGLSHSLRTEEECYNKAISAGAVTVAGALVVVTADRGRGGDFLPVNMSEYACCSSSESSPS
jgi:hypothetical protein